MGPDGVLVINDGDGDVVVTAGENTPEPGQVISFGMGTVENVGDEPVVLIGVTPRLFGDIELVDAVVADGDREALYQTSDDTFPPDDMDFGGFEPLAGHVVTPSAGRSGLPTDNIVLGFTVGTSVAISGMDGYCISYRVGDETRLRTQCWEGQQLVVCEDVRTQVCNVP